VVLCEKEWVREGVEYVQCGIVEMAGFLYISHKIFKVVRSNNEAGDLRDAEEGHQIIEEL
jgi:hypothetical protein